ncbi:hypothetical protein ACQ4PT_042145 [Festuca glaucescens]
MPPRPTASPPSTTSPSPSTSPRRCARSSSAAAPSSRSPPRGLRQHLPRLRTCLPRGRPRDNTHTRWRLRMNSGQTFLLYASAPICLSMSSVTQLAAPGFSGVIRVAFLPDEAMETVLDWHSGCFPTAGEAALNRPFSDEAMGRGLFVLVARSIV